MTELVVGAVLVGIVAVVWVAYLLGIRAARERLERRALLQALAIKTSEVMARPVVVVREDTPIKEAADTMLARKIGGLPVVGRDGALVGIVTESDLTGVRPPMRLDLSSMTPVGRGARGEGATETYGDLAQVRVEKVMTRDVVTASEGEPVDEVVLRMMDRRLHRLPVVDGRVPVGIITRQDLLRLLTRMARGTERASTRS